jgi:hypothetical protein
MLLMILKLKTIFLALKTIDFKLNNFVIFCQFCQNKNKIDHYFLFIKSYIWSSYT